MLRFLEFLLFKVQSSKFKYRENFNLQETMINLITKRIFSHFYTRLNFDNFQEKSTFSSKKSSSKRKKKSHDCRYKDFLTLKWDHHIISSCKVTAVEIIDNFLLLLLTRLIKSCSSTEIFQKRFYTEFLKFKRITFPMTTLLSFRHGRIKVSSDFIPNSSSVRSCDFPARSFRGEERSGSDRRDTRSVRKRLHDGRQGVSCIAESRGPGGKFRCRSRNLHLFSANDSATDERAESAEEEPRGSTWRGKTKATPPRRETIKLAKP